MGNNSLGSRLWESIHPCMRPSSTSYQVYIAGTIFWAEILRPPSSLLSFPSLPHHGVTSGDHGFTPRTPSSLTCPKHLPWQASSRHAGYPNHLKWLILMWTSSGFSLSQRLNYLFKKAPFGSLCWQSDSFVHLQLMTTVSDGMKTDR